MLRQFSTYGLALFLAVCFAGCSTMKCSPENCAADTQITADAQAMFDQHSEFGPPGAIRVQTINGTVYLHGKVSTDLARRSAEALVRQVPNVKNVVNSIDASNVPY
ncbi:MAG TPA: BON domain-containing protein [Steroidobacteraceae bacterium]